MKTRKIFINKLNHRYEVINIIFAIKSLENTAVSHFIIIVWITLI